MRYARRSWSRERGITRFGVRLTCLKSSTNLPLNFNAFATDKFVDAFGSSILKTCGGKGWRHDGKPQLLPQDSLGGWKIVH